MEYKSVLYENVLCFIIALKVAIVYLVLTVLVMNNEQY